MQKISKPFMVSSVVIIAIVAMAFVPYNNQRNKPLKSNSALLTAQVPKIQVAILLDVSGSMDGLIAQAKAQIWNMVNVLGKATNNKQNPNIEIALYEYGRSTNNPKAGYVQQINSFISNLDSLSENLFSLTTNGGDEYCGEAIYQAIDQLKWDQQANNYKVIFIAGNEDFLQGRLQYTQACASAKLKGVIVNTIYCGDKQQGIREHWNLGGECNNGSFTNINTNATIDDIPTPYDSIIYAYNTKLNGTYLNYGIAGASSAIKQSKMDAMNYDMSKAAGVKRIVAKGNKNVYNNTAWDLVDALEKDDKILDKIDINTLADSLKTKSKVAIKAIIVAQTNSRSIAQKEIGALNIKREAFLAAARKNNIKNGEKNLESEMERIIKMQAKLFNYVFE